MNRIVDPDGIGTTELPMRHLFVCNVDPDWNSGAAGSLLALGEALGELGHTVDYLWKLEPGRGLGRIAGFERYFGVPRKQLHQVAEQMSRASYDVVTVSQPFAYRVYEQLGPRYPSTLFLNRTHGWEARGYESDHQYLDRSGEPWSRRLVNRGSQWLMYRACERTARTAHGVVCIARHCAEYIIRRHRIPAERVAVIPYGVGPDFLGVERTIWASEAVVRLLFVGQYLPRKGIDFLEQVLRRVDAARVRATFVVPDYATGRIRERLGDHFGDRLEIRHWVPRSELRDLYGSHDVFLYPSTFEGFGKTFLEAMACGMCVVGYDAGGLADIARDGVDALVCTRGDQAGFEERLRRAIANPDLISRIGAAALQTCAGRTWRKTAEETQDFCHRLRRERQGGSVPTPVTASSSPTAFSRGVG